VDGLIGVRGGWVLRVVVDIGRCLALVARAHLALSNASSKKSIGLLNPFQRELSRT
jgi:hypothetical protein